MITNKPLVSIVMITYNHENFIIEAIEGILMQKCDYPIELIIADDCSPDNTTAVVNNYLKNHPLQNRVKYFKPKKNKGAMPNFTFALNQCNGKYIANCEGDDYWSDPLKLQKQVDLMEADESISLVYTNCEEKYEHTNIPLKTKYTTTMPEGHCLAEIIKGSFPQTVSVLYKRNALINQQDTVLRPHYQMGDYPIALHLANKGKIKYLPDVTCVYRKNDSSISGEVAKNYLKNINFISSCREVLSDFKAENKITDIILLQKIEAQLQHWLLTSFSMSIQNNNTSLAKELWQKIEQNSSPTPLKYQLLNSSTYLGSLGKWLIKSYYN